MPLQATSGAASYDAFGGGVPVVPNYIEDVFSDYLFSGTSASNTINNGVDASGKGALVWIKDRGAASTPHMWFDTTRGVGKYIQSNSTGSQGNIADTLTAFNSNGFTLGADSFGVCNASGHNYVSWMFREAPKFFDVVTFTSNSSGGCTFNHSLGASPGFVTIKRTDSTSNWLTYHRSVGNDAVIYLNTTAASASVPGCFTPSSTQFTVQDGVLANSATYVAYVFAHNAGGFGLTGTDNVISCGSFTTDASGNATVNLGYEPQAVIVKASSTTSNWEMYDSMRGLTATSASARLYPNLSSVEGSTSSTVNATSTGFSVGGNMGAGLGNVTYIYIAIRRGPMKTPTSGTSVFSPVAYTGNGAGASGQTITAGFPIDMASYRYINQPYGGTVTDRLRGFTGTSSKALYTYATSAEATDTEIYGGDSNTSIKSYGFSASYNFVGWYWRRAPSFFDEVCYTGNGVNARAITHNLGVAPEMIIVKKRTGADGWVVWASGLTSRLYELYLNDTRAQFVEASPRLNVNNAPTSTQFEVGTDGEVNASGATYVSYLFASCPGVSKVGSYTGTGATQTISCGFTGGARFVLIKRTDSTGDWYVWDTARGMVSGTDPSLLLNSTAAEVNANSIYTTTGGFQIVSTAAGINASGGTYIYLAIA